MILYEWHETIQWININRSGCDVLRWCCESLRFGCMACRQIRVRIQHHLLGYCWHDWSFGFVSTGWFHVGSQDKSGSRWARIGLAWDWCRRLGAEYKQKRFGYVPLGYRRRCRWFHLTIHDGSWSCGQNIGLARNDIEELSGSGKGLNMSPWGIAGSVEREIGKGWRAAGSPLGLHATHWSKCPGRWLVSLGWYHLLAKTSVSMFN